MKLYLIRHGDPDYANDTLTQRGHAEASALVAYLRNEGIDRIFSSPLGRAQDTARYTAEALGMQVTTEPWMAELELRLVAGQRNAAWDIPGHDVRNPEYLNAPDALESIPTMPAEQVRDAIGHVRRNSDAFLSSLGYEREAGTYRVAKGNDQKIAVFAHGGFGLTWLSLLLEIPTALMWSGFFLHTSSVTQVLFDQRSDEFATPRCIMMSALPHLFAADMEPGTAGIRANYT